MGNAKHTPGPWWFISERGNGLYSGHHIHGSAVFVLAPSIEVAQEFHDNDVFVLPSPADRALIEAAPELLETLRIALELLKAVDPYPGQEDLLTDCVEVSALIIAKATGSAS